MSSWEGKTRGGTLGYKIFIHTIRFLGISGAYTLLRFVAFYYFLFSTKTNRHIYFYFHEILKMNRLRSLINIYRNYFMLGQVLIDKVAVMSGFSRKYSINLEDEKFLKEMQDGGLLISAHVGNWELAGNYLNRLENDFNIVMFDREHKRIKDLLDKIMVEKKIRLILVQDDLSHLIKIKKALDNRELVVIHGDRYIEGSKTITARFMGKDAEFPEGPFYLAARFKTPVSFVFAMKEKRRHYHFYATPAKVYEVKKQEKIEKEELSFILKDYIGALENILTRYPLQWFNYYDFWKS